MEERNGEGKDKSWKVGRKKKKIGMKGRKMKEKHSMYVLGVGGCDL